MKILLILIIVKVCHSFHHDLAHEGWEKQGHVCYGAKGKQYGHFKVTREGALTGVMLEHVSGAITCKGNPDNYWTCRGHWNKYIWTFITDNANNVIFPTSSTYTPGKIENKRYIVKGYHGKSPRLAYLDLGSEVYVLKGQELRIWYFEDLVNFYSSDNSGRHCVNVYVRYDQCQTGF